MNNILEQLFGGEIYPAEQIIPADPAYRPTSLKIGEERENLKKKLCEEDSERLEKLNDMHMEVCSMNCYAGFSYGLKLGVLLMFELFQENSGLEV